MDTLDIMEFTAEYEKAEDKKEVLKKIKIENYVPILLKKQVIEAIIESFVNYEYGMITYEPIDKHMYFALGFISLYTNLTYKHGAEAVDALTRTGVIDYIIRSIGVDYNDFVALFEETLDYKIEFNNSVSNRLSTLLGVFEDTLGKFDIEEFKDILSRLEGLK